LSSPEVPNPWDTVPDGALAPFISPDERDQLIVDGTIFQVTSIALVEVTAHGPKWYVEITMRDGDWNRVCSLDAGDKRHPRMTQLAGLRDWMAKYPGSPLFARLVGAGRGYALAKP
jgi:hypothetical protein